MYHGLDAVGIDKQVIIDHENYHLQTKLLSLIKITTNGDLSTSFRSFCLLASSC